ncbi:hypothetical protein [Sphingobacterium anhuiense]|uniref:hypothetical protein n=1 Tax=Sphingobacterium anhuiense TaxID=493780 RepID=UPI003C300DD2
MSATGVDFEINNSTNDLEVKILSNLYDMNQKTVACSLHGTQKIGLLCTHLAHSLLDQSSVGFHEYNDGDLGRPDAWCHECDAKLQKVTGDSEQEQWFLACDYKILCASCWDEAKELNIR